MVVPEFIVTHNSENFTDPDTLGKLFSTAHQGVGDPCHHGEHHRGHYQQPSLCQVSLQGEPQRTGRKLAIKRTKT